MHVKLGKVRTVLALMLICTAIGIIGSREKERSVAIDGASDLLSENGGSMQEARSAITVADRPELGNMRGRIPTSSPLEGRTGESHLVGQVVDQNGIGFAARVHVSGIKEFSSEFNWGHADELDGRTGIYLETDDRGVFDAALPGAGKVRCQAVGLRGDVRVRAMRSRATGLGGAECTVPATGVVLVLPRAPAAFLRVWLVDSVSGTELSGFKIGYRIEPSGVVGTQRSQGTLLAMDVPLPPDATEGALTLELLEPVTADPPKESVVVTAGQSVALTLGLGGSRLAAGVVVNADGYPVAGATVFFGVIDDGIGDEPFGSFSPSRVRGVTTNETGEFMVGGGGNASLLTVWSPEYATTTVTALPSMRVVLRPRGRIAVACDALDGSQRNQPIALDRDRTIRFGDERVVEFANVDPGLHLIEWPPMAPRLVRVTSDIVVEVVLCQQEVTRHAFLRSGGQSFKQAVTGFVLGVDDGGLLTTFDGAVGSVAYKAVGDGAYWLFTDSGACVELNASTKDTEAELGTAKLRVSGAPGDTAFVLSELWCKDVEVVRLAARLAHRVNESGRLELGPLPAGTYVLYDGSRRFIRTIAVGSGDIDVDMR